MSIIKYREIKAKIKCVEFERKEITYDKYNGKTKN